MFIFVESNDKMMNNLRFATIIHILVLVDQFKDQVISSDFIAGSINVNPVVVRREIKVLKDAGILNSKKGKEGGFFLLKKSSEISFGTIYQIINGGNSFAKQNQTNPKCPIGLQMNAELDCIFSGVEQSIVNHLNEITLDDFSKRFNKSNNTL